MKSEEPVTGTCKMCAHWKKDTDIPDNRAFWQCHAPSVKYGYHIKWSDVPDNGALIEYDEGWGMFTGEEFGCVLYEATKP